ncbi:hypothetical protein ABIC16_004010 [Sphingomonas sp. PvP055]
MPTTLTIIWRKALTPRLIPLCSFYRSEFGTNAPQWDLLVNDRIQRKALPTETPRHSVVRLVRERLSRQGFYPQKDCLV